MNTAPNVLRIEGEMTIYRAAELKHQLEHLLNPGVGSPGAHTIDLSDVTEIDSSGIQLLLLARRASSMAARGLQLVNPSAPVAEVFAALHLEISGAAPASATNVLPH